ncbi:MAG: lysine--tRNA ligase [Candidatus Diapherotrites archaeon]
MENKENREAHFWAEKIADDVINREKFHFTGGKIPKMKKWTVKSSSSLSGVLHIGRLSDLIRGEAVTRALQEKGFPAEFIYVTEDMDPLRKVPEGVPNEFEKYIGFPVSDVPDPEGCHESYAKHFLEKFLNVVNEFMLIEPKIYSMREEYKKGNFTEQIKILMKHADEVKEIIDSQKDTKTESSWVPFKPICENCGNLQTTEITKVEGDKVHYVCKDYKFEKFTAKGCNYEGATDLNKPSGKLAWKSEWAAQWMRWNVCSEGAGKEYESKNSAFWVNAEICEKILKFPKPEPIFYEHLLIDGVKMSASVGNVVYPADWLKVSRPETLKYLYMKRINKARSFSWKEVPLLELELDRSLLADVSDKEGAKMRKVADYSSVKGRKLIPLKADYSTISFLTQTIPDGKKVIEKLKDLGKISGKESKEEMNFITERIDKSREWIQNFAPEEARFTILETVSDEVKKKLKDNEKKALSQIPGILKEGISEEELGKKLFDIANENKIPPKEFFKVSYLVLLNRERGPKLATLILGIGIDRSKAIFGQLK